MPDPGSDSGVQQHRKEADDHRQCSPVLPTLHGAPGKNRIRPCRSLRRPPAAFRPHLHVLPGRPGATGSCHRWPVGPDERRRPAMPGRCRHGLSRRPNATRSRRCRCLVRLRKHRRPAIPSQLPDGLPGRPGAEDSRPHFRGSRGWPCSQQHPYLVGPPRFGCLPREHRVISRRQPTPPHNGTTPVNLPVQGEHRWHCSNLVAIGYGAQTARRHAIGVVPPIKEDPRRGLQSQPLPIPNANLPGPMIRVSAPVAGPAHDGATTPISAIRLSRGGCAPALAAPGPPRQRPAPAARRNRALAVGPAIG